MLDDKTSDLLSQLEASADQIAGEIARSSVSVVEGLELADDAKWHAEDRLAARQHVEAFLDTVKGGGAPGSGVLDDVRERASTQAREKVPLAVMLRFYLVAERIVSSAILRAADKDSRLEDAARSLAAKASEYSIAVVAAMAEAYVDAVQGELVDLDAARRALFDVLLTSDPGNLPALTSWAQKLGLDSGREYRVVVSVVDGYDGHDLTFGILPWAARAIERCSGQTVSEAFVVSREHDMVAILEVEPGKAMRSVLESAAQEVQRTGRALMRAGVGRPFVGLEGVASSYHDACHALKHTDVRRPIVVGPDDTALFEESAALAEASRLTARRQSTRRWLLLASASLILAGGLAGGLLAATGPTTPKPAKPTSPTQPVSHGMPIRALGFAGPFAPEQVVSEGSAVWVVGSTEPGTDTRCAIEEVDAATLSTTLFPISACALDIAAGNGKLFLATSGGVPGTNFRPVRIEVFDTLTDTTSILAPIDVTLTGSEIAHTAIAYGEDSLWLYAYQAHSEVFEISPSTGAVLATFSDVPQIGGHFPAIVANAGGLWVAGGPGGGPDIDLFRSGSSAPTVVYQGTGQNSVLWLSSIGNAVWADIATYQTGGQSVTTTTQLVEFDTSGQRVLESAPEQTGDFALVETTGAELWSVGVSSSCTGPQDLLEIDGATGTSSVASQLRTPVAACLAEPYASPLASVGQFVFVLEPTGTQSHASVLYRIES